MFEFSRFDGRPLLHETDAMTVQAWTAAKEEP